MGLRRGGGGESMRKNGFRGGHPKKKKIREKGRLRAVSFFFRFSAGSVRERERRADVVICVSRTFCLTDQEKRETARSLGKGRIM